MVDHFVDIGRNVDYHCLIFFAFHERFIKFVECHALICMWQYLLSHTWLILEF